MLHLPRRAHAAPLAFLEPPMTIDRRRFLKQTAALGLASAGVTISADHREGGAAPQAAEAAVPMGQLDYRGPNVIVIRFGGGVRRLETIQDEARTACPFIYHELYKRQGGLLCPNMEIASLDGVVTSHGQGTLYILTGKYDKYEDISHRPFADRFVAKVPTIFEYFRGKYNVPAHQALIINGEDRINEEFYTFSNHHQFGIRYRSTVLSLFRYKTFLLREQIAAGRFDGEELERKRQELEGMENLDYRVENRDQVANPAIDEFWQRWRGYYGESGMVNPRGDRLLTTLAQWSIRHLRPKLMMINYQDPDYVHWGNRQFYTRAISIIDEGVREIYQAVQGDEEYRDNTVFVIVPDCGRDSNRCMAVPFQHHFNTPSAHEIFAIVNGPRRLLPAESRPNDRLVQQAYVARTIGQLMDFETPDAATTSLLG
jgi:hypothetical protein